MEDPMEVKTLRGKQRRTLPQSQEEAVQMWEESRIETPETIEDLVERGWGFDGGDETLSWDCKTSEGFAEFYRSVDGFHLHVKIPFTSVRVYGKAAINYATFDTTSSDKDRQLAFLDFEDGKVTSAGTFEKGQSVNFPAVNAANGR
jgi:hypothetical protein